MGAATLERLSVEGFREETFDTERNVPRRHRLAAALSRTTQCSIETSPAYWLSFH